MKVTFSTTDQNGAFRFEVTATVDFGKEGKYEGGSLREPDDPDQVSLDSITVKPECDLTEITEEDILQLEGATRTAVIKAISQRESFDIPNAEVSKEIEKMLEEKAIEEAYETRP